MTSIIIFEGIPTSGKTALITKVAQILQSKNKTVEFVSDKEVNELFMQKNNLKDKTSIKNGSEHLKNILQKKLLKKPDYILIHNFHLFYLTTNNARGEKETLMRTYGEIEAMLEVHPSLLVYLEIETRYILPSFHKRFATYEAQGEEDLFKTVLEAKGSQFEQLAYYQKKQNSYKEQLKKTKLHTLHLIIKKDTLYYDLAQKIVEKVS